MAKNWGGVNYVAAQYLEAHFDGKVAVLVSDGVHDSPSIQEEPAEDNRPSKDWILPKETELRVEVGKENVVDIRVHLL